MRVAAAVLIALALLPVTAAEGLAQCGVSFSNGVQPILTARCTSCHLGPTPAAGLDLTAGNSYGALVNVASGECLAYKRVNPGSPGTSYLIFKLQGFGPCFFPVQMPADGPPLSVSDMNKITSWITQGAPNN